MKSVEVESATAALRILECPAKHGEAIRVALIDYHLPELGGFALVEQIRQQEPIAAATILMLTSVGQPGDAARCRSLGIAAYLTKPISQAWLIDAIRLALGRVSEINSPANLITRHSLSPKRTQLRILLAEDNPVNQKIASRMLERQGHCVTIAGNGHQVLVTLEQQSFDLILMDIQMPLMDGFETTAAIRKNERGGKRIPIIALTAHSMSGDRERCIAADMDGYITKPIRLPELIGEIHRLQSGAILQLGAEQLLPTTF